MRYYNNYYGNMIDPPRLMIVHSAKGSQWKDHKYIRKENGVYIYAEDESKSKKMDRYRKGTEDENKSKKMDRHGRSTTNPLDKSDIKRAERHLVEKARADANDQYAKAKQKADRIVSYVSYDRREEENKKKAEESRRVANAQYAKARVAADKAVANANVVKEARRVADENYWNASNEATKAMNRAYQKDLQDRAIKSDLERAREKRIQQNREKNADLQKKAQNAANANYASARYKADKAVNETNSKRKAEEERKAQQKANADRAQNKSRRERAAKNAAEKLTSGIQSGIRSQMNEVDRQAKNKQRSKSKVEEARMAQRNEELKETQLKELRSKQKEREEAEKRLKYGRLYDSGKSTFDDVMNVLSNSSRKTTKNQRNSNGKKRKR